MNNSSAENHSVKMFPLYRSFLCGIHFIQSDLNEAYKHRSVEKFKMPEKEVFDRLMPECFVSESPLYDKKYVKGAQNFFRKWAHYLHRFPSFFPIVIKRDVDEYLKNNDTIANVIKFASSMARNHLFCKVFPSVRKKVANAGHENSSSAFEHYLDELKRWNFHEDDVAFVNILHEAVHPYEDEKVLQWRNVEIAGTKMKIPYGTLDMCPEDI